MAEEQPIVPEKGNCFIVRRSPGCGCCPEEATYFGPWLSKEQAETFATIQKQSYENRDRHYEVGQNIPYEIAGRFLVLKERYALDRGFADDSSPETAYDKELEDYSRLYRYF
jgi:hypothetical protein